MKGETLGGLFLRHLVMSVPWTLAALVAFVVCTVGVKQQIKEGIQFGVRMALYETVRVAYRFPGVATVKDDIREEIEFAAQTAGREVRALLSDPTVREQIREAVGFADAY